MALLQETPAAQAAQMRARGHAELEGVHTVAGLLSTIDHHSLCCVQAEMDSLRATLERNNARAPLQGTYAEEARTLQDWLGQYLMARYETRRGIVAAEYRAIAARHVAKHANPVT